MKQFLIFSFSLFISLAVVKPALAQLTVDGSLTPQQLVQTVLVGNGISASNVTYTGPAVSIGSFNSTASNVGFASGILLTTGDINGAIGPNNSGNTSTDNVSSGDPDLTQIVTALVGTQDASVLEFDFIPSSDTLQFNYVFGSEEYLEWVNGGFNDVFGFFISGPGISGPYSNNAMNIALIPGTTTPVSIDNVNNVQNSSYYHDNITPAPPNSAIQFDGFTIPLVATAIVQCGQTYHIKLAIADAGDGSLDSGVFLEAGSFSSSVLQLAAINSLNADTLAPEGCSDGVLQFTRENVQAQQIIYISTSGTASEGVDYAQLPDSIIFPAAEDTVVTTFDIFGDGNIEGTETVTISFSVINDCGDSVTVSKTLYIIEDYTVEVAADAVTVNCPADSILLTAQALNGFPDFTFNWSNGDMGDSIYIQPPNGIDTLILSLTDVCGRTSENDTVIVIYNPALPPQISITPQQDTVCPGAAAQVSLALSGGLGPFIILWNTGLVGNMLNVNPVQTTSYWATVSDGCNRVYFSDTASLVINPPMSLTLNNDTIALFCPGDSVTVHPVVSDGNPGYLYQWSDGSSSPNLIATPFTTTDYTVLVTDQCNETHQAGVTVTVPVYSLITSLTADSLICRNTQVQVTSSVEGGAGNYTYTWSGTDNIQTNAGMDSATATIENTTIFVLNITDQCNNSAETSVTVQTENCEVVIPNIFTPNGDAFNDLFFIQNIEQYPGSSLILYNRWGRKVYESDDYKNDWDGEKLADGTYYYIVTVADPDQGTLTGHVTIFRN